MTTVSELIINRRMNGEYMATEGECPYSEWLANAILSGQPPPVKLIHQRPSEHMISLWERACSRRRRISHL
jgi:hypothetical protein